MADLNHLKQSLNKEAFKIEDSIFQNLKNHENGFFKKSEIILIELKKKSLNLENHQQFLDNYEKELKNSLKKAQKSFLKKSMVQIQNSFEQKILDIQDNLFKVLSKSYKNLILDLYESFQKNNNVQNFLLSSIKKSFGEMLTDFGMSEKNFAQFNEENEFQEFLDKFQNISDITKISKKENEEDETDEAEKLIKRIEKTQTTTNSNEEKTEKGGILSAIKGILNKKKTGVPKMNLGNKANFKYYYKILQY